MKPLRFVCLSFAVLLVSSAFTHTAQAQYPGFGFGYGWGNLGQFGVNRLNANARVIPYFALHPPVYYSQSVPRPYGYSPFALPPGMQPAEAIAKPAPKQEQVINPYFRPHNDKKVDTDKPVTTAKLIVNPYVKQPGQIDDQRLVRSVNGKHRPE